MLNFQFCLNTVLGHSEGFEIKSDVKFFACQRSLLDCNEITAHEKCSFHFLMFLDGYLIPAPYYGGINPKTWLYGGIQPVHAPLFSEVKLQLFTYINRHFTRNNRKNLKMQTESKRRDGTSLALFETACLALRLQHDRRLLSSDV